MRSYSQRGQDRWVVDEVFRGKRGGFFLDLAASDGVNTSNTYLLETEYGWDGICIEANPFLFRQLRAYRKCRCVNACIDGERHEVEFFLYGLVGGIVDEDTDNTPLAIRQRMGGASMRGKLITLRTELLEDVLAELEAPRTIGYFSFDVEGAESRILESFPFHEYRFLAMTVERPAPELNQLLLQNGYVLVRKTELDSFYVHESLDAGVVP
jgi:hypothetical protein